MDDEHCAIPVKLFINEAFYNQSSATTAATPVKQEIDFGNETEPTNNASNTTKQQSDHDIAYQQFLENDKSIQSSGNVIGEDVELFRRSYNQDNFLLKKESDKNYSVSCTTVDQFEIKVENAEDGDGKPLGRIDDDDASLREEERVPEISQDESRALPLSRSQIYPNFLHSSSTKEINATNASTSGLDSTVTKSVSHFSLEELEGEDETKEEEVMKADDDEGKPSLSDCQGSPSNERPQKPKRKRPDQQFNCYVCNKIFNRKCNLQTHLRVHTGEKPYNCTVCSRAFGDKSTLNSHMMQHTGTKPFICSLCDKSFINCGTLEIHMRIHTGERPYECSLCDRAFTDASNLRAHMKIHTNEKPFACSMCEKAFSENRHLQRHIRSHTGEKPYECNVCLNAFADKSTLNSHMRTHTGDKRHICELCGKAFGKGSNLKSHIRTHTGEKPHPCPVCGKGFSKSCHVKKHMRTHMKDKPVTTDAAANSCCLASINHRTTATSPDDGDIVNYPFSIQIPEPL